MLDEILYIVGQRDMPLQLLQSILSLFLYIGTRIDSYSGNSSLFQIELISLWISEQIILPTALINSAGIWSAPCDMCPFTFSIAISTSEALGSATGGSAVYICLP